MKISELIKELNEILETNGDLNVRLAIQTNDSFYTKAKTDADCIEVIEREKCIEIS